MEIYLDAAFADNEQDRKSLQGVLIMMYGAAIDWQAKKRRTVTKSTTEAELLALLSIAGSGYWWKRLFTEIDPIFEDTSTSPNPDISSSTLPNPDTSSSTSSSTSIKVYCDNLQAVDIANSTTGPVHTALRHVDVHQHWIRQETMAKRLVVEWIPSNKQRADGLTKLLPKQPFKAFRESMGIAKVGIGA